MTFADLLELLNRNEVRFRLASDTLQANAACIERLTSELTEARRALAEESALSRRWQENAEACLRNYGAAEKVVKELLHLAGGRVVVPFAAVRWVEEEGDLHEIEFTVEELRARAELKLVRKTQH